MLAATISLSTVSGYMRPTQPVSPCAVTTATACRYDTHAATAAWPITVPDGNELHREPGEGELPHHREDELRHPGDGTSAIGVLRSLAARSRRWPGPPTPPARIELIRFPAQIANAGAAGATWPHGTSAGAISPLMGAARAA